MAEAVDAATLAFRKDASGNELCHCETRTFLGATENMSQRVDKTATVLWDGQRTCSPPDMPQGPGGVIF